MCILCVIQKWSRRVATMLPWLVIPLIGLWTLSHILPPAFRFEITSPKLACVFVLLVTIFWYEILIPQLSAWRVQRNFWLRESKRLEAIEMQKLRKIATRRCRNCLTPYRDQNPGGGRFMCSYCGHVSKRPVLDHPTSKLGFSNSGILKDFIGKSEKILNGNVWSDNGWMCSQGWLENGNWVSDSFVGKSNFWRENGGEFFSGDGHCMAERSYSRVVIFAYEVLKAFFLSIGWFWRKITRVSSARDDSLSDAEHKGVLANEGENGGNFHESKREKARRKAEEKRLARLERKLLEEEDRKQREEVSSLVEEHRKLRDENVEAENDRSKGSTAAMEKDSKKEADKRRKERRKEKDRGSSKSKSDVEELEKRTGKESKRKWEFDRKSEIDRREHHRICPESAKGHSKEVAHGSKSWTVNNRDLGNAGTRYEDRMRGTFLSSSEAFCGRSFFGKGVDTSATISRENKPNASADNVHTPTNRRESSKYGKSNMNGDDKTINCPVLIEPQSTATPKRSWQQLFSRSSSVPSPTNSNIMSRPNSESQEEVQSSPFAGHSFFAQSYDNPINFGLPSPFILPNFQSVSSSSYTVPPLTSETMLSYIGEAHHDFLPEVPEIIEDPFYDPDPVYLLGPVLESLENFQLDMGTGVATDRGLEKPRALKNIYAPAVVNRPSPIEPPMPRTRVYDEKHFNFSRYPSTPVAQDMHTSQVDDFSRYPTTLGQDDFGLVGSQDGWLLPPELNRSNKDDLLHLTSQNTAASIFTKDDQAFSSIHPPHVLLGGFQNCGTYAASLPGSRDDPRLPKSPLGPMPVSEGHCSLNPLEETSRKDKI